MKLHFTVTEQAYLDFNIDHIEHSDSLRKAAGRARLIVPLVLLFIGASFTVFIVCKFGIHAFPLAYLAGCLAVSALWYVLYPAYYRRILEKRLKSYLAEGNGKEFLGDFTLELLDDRLRMAGAGGVTEALYANVGKLIENKGCLYIYIGSMTAVILPLDAFGSAETYREFRHLLEEKMQAVGGARLAAGSVKIIPQRRGFENLSFIVFPNKGSPLRGASFLLGAFLFFGGGFGGLLGSGRTFRLVGFIVQAFADGLEIFEGRVFAFLQQLVAPFFKHGGRAQSGHSQGDK